MCPRFFPGKILHVLFHTAAFLCTEADLKALASTLHISQKKAGILSCSKPHCWLYLLCFYFPNHSTLHVDVGGSVCTDLGMKSPAFNPLGVPPNLSASTILYAVAC